VAALAPATIEIGIAKVNKYASRESGDTAEVVERASGGISVVMVDGQGSGAAAKSLSLMLTAKAVALLKEGVRDGAVARAVHDSLLAYRGGRVSASLDIISADLKHGDVVLTRNTTTPALVVRSSEPELLPPTEGPIGIYHFTRPAVSRYPIAVGLEIWCVTDGVVGSGSRSGLAPMGLASAYADLPTDAIDALSRARAFLQVAIDRDGGRPGDDMCVALLRIVEGAGTSPVRTLHVTFGVA
jgi:hypothetical protein